ncbi:MAG: tetratricopeptide repeat protein [Candidatus Aminicenantes bacterium]|nr:tetratricopeptide repeat protein [Candidatus Aminicenantes bacterium]NIM79158.1 tetratricopeptide repeat protein [Candidatus Aminicenantes bacterium]NIN18443.1 tetratricopeptide repeat protein [Candidatus Aminicenantes bacterium]NIN42331.1 tetratricopeptide repeat protein [Candidatus Aminicenantes bacterium]NIN85097.1 tetratricopeptide repeat protein [Candidatus Aminicenantes bacterium]
MTIKPAERENENLFQITWQKKGINLQNSFNQNAEDITQEEVEQLWQQPKHQLAVGSKLFRFLDGDTRHLQQALDEADREGESLQINLCPCSQTADWPFELLAQDGTFLLPQRVHLVRCVSDWGAERELLEDRPLKLLFMACSAMDVEPELDFEKEEEAIFEVTKKLAVDMEVEDSGSLEGLREQLEYQQYDVVHLSGHAGIDRQGRPFFIMENENGFRCDVFPNKLWDEALIENPPRLLFLSGCRTGEAADTFAAVSFARGLVERYNVPAILGWGRSVSDEQATHAEKMLYRKLSQGRTILEAVHRARTELIKDFPLTPNPAWPLLRLFSSGMALDAIVKQGQQPRLSPRRMIHVFLRQSQVQVLAEGFVGRRRQLQHSIRVLKQDYEEKVGLLLLGTGGLGKSCLAGKIIERFSDHTLVIVHGEFDAITLEPALRDAFIQAQDEKGIQILSAEKETSEKLAELCPASFRDRNYLILLDDFEQNLEGAGEGQPGDLLSEAAELLKTLLHYLPYSRKMTQVIITSRYSFSLTEQSQDLVKERLEWITLTSFQESEQRKKVRELNNIFNYADQSLVPRLVASGHGNPWLMEWLDVLVGQMKTAEVPQLLEAIGGKQEEFIRKHVMRELLQRGGDELAHFLHWFCIYRQPVLKEGVEEIGEKARLERWQKLLQEGMGLSLIEHDQARQDYQATPLLREELLTELKDKQSCHQAAFTYYKKICKGQESINPILVEEWIYHALGCGEEEVASEQGEILVKNLRERLDFQESRRVGLWILEEKKKELSTPNDASLLNALASTIHDLGDYRKAIEYFEQALEIDRWVYGKGDERVAVRLNNLGEAWRALKDPKKAIEYYKQALTILKNVYGGKHQKVATILNNLGSAWFSLNEQESAIGYFKQALSIDQEVYGKEHQNVANDFSNLGSAWKAWGDNEKAHEYYKNALAILKKIYGDFHPQVATVLSNLGGTYLELGQKEKAKRYFENAYTIFEKFFEPEHPNTKTVAKWLEKCR